MADIRKYPLLRHLRSEPSFHVLRHRKGKLTGSGRGLSFWFRAMNTSVAELPIDDRDLPFLFHGRTMDYQEVTVQGTITWRVADAEVLGRRIDFTLDLNTGVYRRQPLDQIAILLTGIAQQAALKYLAEKQVRELLEDGPGPIQKEVAREITGAAILEEMGIQVLTAQVGAISPTAEMEGALQTPMREKIQEAADKARFERRAQAVEEERAIGENELQSRIEMAKKQENLIDQEGQNRRREVTEETEAKRIETEAQAARMKQETETQAEMAKVEAAALAERTRIEAGANAERTRVETQATAERVRVETETEAARTRIETEVQAERTRTEAEAEAERIRAVEGERVAAEREQMEIYRDLPPQVMIGFAAQDLAQKLKIEHLNITPELLIPAVEKLIQAGAKKLAAVEKG
jgi:hypothetical protein